MLSFFAEQYDDLLDETSLPPTENTEMNYRTRPLTTSQERRLTTLFLMLPVPITLTISGVFRVATEMSPWLDDFSFSVGIVALVWFSFRLLTRSFVRWEAIAGALYCVGVNGATLWKWQALGHNCTACAALLLTWLVSRIIVRQMAAWICVDPAVDSSTLRTWRQSIPGHGFLQVTKECRELVTFSMSPLLVSGGWWLAVKTSEECLGTAEWWCLFFAPSVILCWVAWHVVGAALGLRPSFFLSVRLAWRAVLVFVTYNPFQTQAAGVFRFPTRWVRAPIHRWGLVVTTLMVLGTCCVTSLPSPHAIGGPTNVFVAIFGNFVIATIFGPVTLLVILWATGGTVLARFHRELCTGDSSEANEWDNYVDRIVNSDDELESEHILLGVCENGDYPVLVHREIYDQHCHILGDSGASKTALGIAPQATQLIARGDSTVVIVDLKGDKALFEGCRRESERAGLRFRWLSNEVGSNSFAFNPFLQSHNERLSVEQITQQLLQGLSLDYGLQYGAGYFTAMNEIVLSSVLQETGARSFQELSRHLDNKKWYSTIGNADDWAQARHLGSLVKRLAGSTAINVVPGMFADEPAVHEQAIDAANLFDEPQVVYLCLRSAVESTNAPTIARLFLWAMFTAASHHPNDGNRVYFFMDEVQQIISDGLKLVFEQFRDLGGTIIAAHQTASQLRRQGTDLGDTIDSCTAVKQVFRASDLFSLERLEKLSGTRRENVPTWYQPFERGLGDLRERYDPTLAIDGVVRLSNEEKVRYSKDDLLEISSRKTSSLVRFTFGSGYTQFAGATIPVRSQFHIDFGEYKRRRQMPWPDAAGAFEITKPKIEAATDDSTDDSANQNEEPTATVPDGNEGFADEFERRAREMASFRT